MVAQEVVLCDAQFEIEDVEELALDASYVAFAEDTGA